MKRLYYYLIQRVIPRFLGRMIKLLSTLLSMTYSYKVNGFDQFNQIAKDEGAVLALWHQKLVIIPPILSKFTPFSYAALVSNSKEGEILSQVVNSYKRGRAVRIAHNAKSAGLVGAIDTVKQGLVLVITPDGPRGPSQEVKGGIFTIAKNADAHIFPINWTSDTCWNLKTWDKMLIPKPFSTITVSIGAPLPKETAHFEKKEAAALLKTKIDQISW